MYSLSLFSNSRRTLATAAPSFLRSDATSAAARTTAPYHATMTERGSRRSCCPAERPVRFDIP
jgi:hypothetical protein